MTGIVEEKIDSVNPDFLDRIYRGVFHCDFVAMSV